MGGRKVSSSRSKKGKLHITEYTTLHTDGNIKFVSYNGRNAKP